MAKRSKRLDTLLEVTEFVKDKPRAKRGVYTLDDIERDIADRELREAVKARYTAYLDAIEEYKQVRLTLMAKKTDLQNALNEPFVRGGLVSQSEYWALAIDPKTMAIVFRDDEESFRRRYENYRERSTEGGRRIVRTEKPKWEFGTVGILQPVELPTLGASRGTPRQGTSTDTPSFETNPQGFLERFTSLSDPKERYNLFNTLGEEAQLVFYENALTEEQRASIFPHFDADQRHNMEDVPRAKGAPNFLRTARR